MANQINRPINRSIPHILTAALLTAGFIIDLITMSCTVSATGQSVWRSAGLWIEKNDYTPAICMAFILLFVINTAVTAAGVATVLLRHKTPIYPFGISLSIHVILLVLSMGFGILGTLGGISLVLHLLLTIAGMIYSIALTMIGSDKKTKRAGALFDHRRRVLSYSLGAFSTLVSFSLFYQPFYSYVTGDEVRSLVPLGLLTSYANKIVALVVFAALFAVCTVSLVLFLKCFECYSAPDAGYAAKLRRVIALNTCISGGYFVAGVTYCAIGNARGGQYSANSYLPFLISTAVAILFAFLERGIDRSGENEQTKKMRAASIEFFVYGLLVAGLTVASALSDILRVQITEPTELEALRLNGWKILTSYDSLNAGFQLIAFLVIVVLTVMIGLFIASLVSLISKSRLFYKITLTEIICGAVASLIIGLFGKYYEVVQQINKEIIISWIRMVYEIDEFLIVYKVSSQSFWWLLAVVAIIVVLLIRKPYTRGTLGDLVVSVDTPLQAGEEEKKETPDLPEEDKEAVPTVKEDADPCPAFTELDGKIEAFREEQAMADVFRFDTPTLPELVRFVVQYARDSRLHLSYTAEDVAAFVAGLGAARLTILQGMSGTGKTSLPKIFMEAIMGNCEIIEVESSWRDKNELLGYYNEFSRTYTPKKFTQALYKAKLNPKRMTFIVLDEMNLSRIEYYFSDFLSLMENEEDKRAIKLLNVGLYRTVGGKRYPYRGLSEGHTIRIPNNVWFIGTANRDESTFEISDKVYDRAHTMNFNTRAPKVLYRHDPIAQRYLSVEAFMGLIEEAKKTVHFDLDTCALIGEVEELLAPYNISFGNRVANQIEDFVRIYTACFAPTETIMNDALEIILLSKVVSKLEFRSIDNKEQLAASFRRLRLNRCADFILKLNED